MCCRYFITPTDHTQTRLFLTTHYPACHPAHCNPFPLRLWSLPLLTAGCAGVTLTCLPPCTLPNHQPSGCGVTTLYVATCRLSRPRLLTPGYAGVIGWACSAACCAWPSPPGAGGAPPGPPRLSGSHLSWASRGGPSTAPRGSRAGELLTFNYMTYISMA
jgi:hypothetical protein